jgi:hypothetical protein
MGGASDNMFVACRSTVLTWLDSSIVSISLELHRVASKVTTAIMATTILTAVETGIVVNLFGSCLFGAGKLRFCWLALMLAIVRM